MEIKNIAERLEKLDEEQVQIIEQLNNNSFLNNFIKRNLDWVESDFNCPLFCIEVLIGVLNNKAQDERNGIPLSKACIASIILMHELSQIREERSLLTSAWILEQS